MSGPPSFHAYVKALDLGDDLGGCVPINYHDNWGIYTIDDKVAVDRIIQFESLVHGLGQVLHDVGVDWDGWLPRAKARKSSGTAVRQDYRAHYDGETRQIVAALYRKEIALFGYAF